MVDREVVSFDWLCCNDSSSETVPWRMNSSPSRDENQVLNNGNRGRENHMPIYPGRAFQHPTLQFSETERNVSMALTMTASYERYVKHTSMTHQNCLWITKNGY